MAAIPAMISGTPGGGFRLGFRCAATLPRAAKLRSGGERPELGTNRAPIGLAEREWKCQLSELSAMSATHFSAHDAELADARGKSLSNSDLWQT